MFVKGKSGNPKGRPAGSPNKATEDIREKVNTFISDNLDTIQADIMELEPKERVRFFLELLSFAIPKIKMQSIDVTTDGEQINRPNVVTTLTPDQLKEYLKK